MRSLNAKDRDAAFAALFALAQSNDNLAKECAGLRAAPAIDTRDVEALKYGAYRIEDWAGKPTDESRRLLVLAFRLGGGE